MVVDAILNFDVMMTLLQLEKMYPAKVHFSFLNNELYLAVVDYVQPFPFSVFIPLDKVASKLNDLILQAPITFIRALDLSVFTNKPNGNTPIWS
jgi:hypothetical protein